jgi:hypothetical protein
MAEAIALVISQLVELNVTTELAATETHAPSSLSTKISLLTGQITTAVQPDLLSQESSQQILAFHTAQITATNEVVRDHLHSLRELLQILRGVAITLATNSVPETTIPSSAQIVDQTADESKAVDISTDLSFVSEPPVLVEIAAEPSTPLTANIPPLTTPALDVDYENINDKVEIASIADEFQHIENLLRHSERPKTENGSRASAGMAAAVAQAGSPKLDEANTIPNKFDQVLKSAGVKEKEDAANNPFISGGLAADEPENIQQPPVNTNQLDELGIDQEWNEWLLEEDAILSELSQVNEEVTKEKIPEWDEKWFTRADEPPLASEDWENFIPEYVDFDAPVHQEQANVQRFRQNLVNDPQLMSELLAELDDIERLNKDEQSK